jgi:anti-anti-sigma factor
MATSAHEGVKLELRVQDAGDGLLISTSGELDRSAAKMFEAELQRPIEGDASGVILDLGGIEVIDSTGLRSALRVANHSRRNGDRLRTLRGSPPLERAIEWGGLEHLLPLVD